MNLIPTLLPQDHELIVEVLADPPVFMLWYLALARLAAWYKGDWHDCECDRRYLAQSRTTSYSSHSRQARFPVGYILNSLYWQRFYNSRAELVPP